MSPVSSLIHRRTAGGAGHILGAFSISMRSFELTLPHREYTLIMDEASCTSRMVPPYMRGWLGQWLRGILALDAIDLRTVDR